MKYLILFALIFFSQPLFSQQPKNQTQFEARSLSELSITTETYMLSDFQSGQILVSQNATKRIEPASLTKMMTAHIVFSALRQKRITLKQVVPISEKAWRAKGSRMFIEPGKVVTIEELINGLIVQSGNDASIALAEAIAGSEEIFVRMMNKEAKRLGMKDTNFTNSSGLPNPEHFTTAYDLALLVSDMIRRFPEHYSLYSLREYTYNKISQSNRNRLLWLDPNVDGLKTGYTKSAGYCLVASAKRNNRRLISIVLGAKSDSVRTVESQRLLNYGFLSYDTVRVFRKGQRVTIIELWKGQKEALKTGFNQDLYFSFPKGQAAKLKATMEYKKPLIAPIKVGQKVGIVKFMFDGIKMGQYPLVALESISSSNFLSRTWDEILLLAN
ncbi:MAG: peptidase [Nitrosomonadaceae bacterium]|nr:peptidase [Nitrosomonadaceae bacterium]|tara:strand:+ start:549 stop:1703 length:1155 start_codon:yes stop_codon:yes gene_type:complete